MFRGFLFLLFGLVCEAQWQQTSPYTFEGWLSQQAKLFNDISKQQKLYNHLLEFATSPYLAKILSHVNAFKNAVAATNISKACEDAVTFAQNEPKSNWSTNSKSFFKYRAKFISALTGTCAYMHVIEAVHKHDMYPHRSIELLPTFSLRSL